MSYLSRSWAAYPLISKWHDTMRQHKGIKEVHDTWDAGVLPKIIEIVKHADSTA